jgi:hypothetical protein
VVLAGILEVGKSLVVVEPVLLKHRNCDAIDDRRDHRIALINLVPVLMHVGIEPLAKLLHAGNGVFIVLALVANHEERPEEEDAVASLHANDMSMDDQWPRTYAVEKTYACGDGMCDFLLKRRSSGSFALVIDPHGWHQAKGDGTAGLRCNDSAVGFCTAFGCEISSLFSSSSASLARIGAILGFELLHCDGASGQVLVARSLAAAVEGAHVGALHAAVLEQWLEGSTAGEERRSHWEERRASIRDGNSRGRARRSRRNFIGT